MAGSTIHGRQSVARSVAVENPVRFARPGRLSRAWPWGLAISALGRLFAARARRAHRLDRQGGRHLDFDDDGLAFRQPRYDPMQDVRPCDLMLARRQELAEEPSVDVLDVF